MRVPQAVDFCKLDLFWFTMAPGAVSRLARALALRAGPVRGESARGKVRKGERTRRKMLNRTTLQYSIEQILDACSCGVILPFCQLEDTVTKMGATGLAQIRGPWPAAVA